MKSIFPIFSALALVLFILQACEEQEPIPSTHEFGDCLLLEVAEDRFAPNCDREVPEIDTSQYCDPIVLEEVFRLNSIDRLWLPFYCCQQGELITYVNEANKKENLYIASKRYIITPFRFFDKQNCSEFPDKKQPYCANVESARIELFYTTNTNTTVATFPGEEISGITRLSIDLSINIVQDETNSDQFYSGTSITFDKMLVGGPKEDTISHIQGIINEGTLPEQYHSTTEFYDSLTLAGRTFFNIHAFSSELDNTMSKIYYNTDIGLVSFIDETGETWRLSDEFK